MTDDEWLERRRAALAFRRDVGFISKSTGSAFDRTHGISSYRKGCRCDLCKEAHAQHLKRYRQRKKAAA